MWLLHEISLDTAGMIYNQAKQETLAWLSICWNETSVNQPWSWREQCYGH